HDPRVEEVGDRPIRALELDEPMHGVAEHAVFHARILPRVSLGGRAGSRRTPQEGGRPGEDALGAQIPELADERLDRDARRAHRERVVVEAPLELRARGTPVATIMRTPGHDLELVRGLLHAESLGPAALTQVDDDAVEVDVAAGAFAGRGLL